MQRFASTLALTAVLSITALAQDGSRPSPSPSPDMPAEFKDGIKAMNDGHWKEALTDFDKVHDAGNDTMAQSLYWKAYNLQKLDRTSEATNACVDLRRRYPDSPWGVECAALRVNRPYVIRVKDGSGTNIQTEVRGQLQDQLAQQYAEVAQQYAYTVNTDPRDHTKFTLNSLRTGKMDTDDEIRLIALNSLMQQEPEKALPALRTFLSSDKPVEAKRRAMFVLEQSKSPEAQKLLADTAASNSSPELQRAAVWAIASHPKEHTAELVSIYKGSNDHEVKRAAASGLMSAHDATDLVQLAKGETDSEIKRTLVSYLGDMHDPVAVAYMEELVKQ